MTTVVVGSNHFIDCAAVIAVQQHALLEVAVGPLRVSLMTPPGLPVRRSVHVFKNEFDPATDPSVKVVSCDKSVAIFLDETPLVLATVVGEDKINLRVDLRPVGIDLFDDALGLHIGNNLLTGNRITGVPAAVSLR